MLPPGIREASHRLAGIGPMDPDAPGQRLGLATAEHGAVPVPASGPGIAGGIIAFGAPAAPTPADSQPDEVAAPDGHAVDGQAVDDQTQEAAVEAAAAAEGVDVERIADQASPSGEDPAVQGAEADDHPAGDR
jgi:NADH-quinone oxidoreductase subunit E